MNEVKPMQVQTSDLPYPAMKTIRRFVVVLCYMLFQFPVPAAPGDVDMSFNPDTNNSVSCVAVQPNGKILIAGGFTAVGGVTRHDIARLNANGTLDESFNPSVPIYSVTCVTVQTDGRIFITGTFYSVNGMPAYNAAWLNADGTLNRGFIPPLSLAPGSGAGPLAVLADGTTLVAGYFDVTDNFGHSVRTHGSIARVTADWTLDAHLNSDGTAVVGFNPDIFQPGVTLLVQPDGKLLISGYFNSVDGIERRYLARLNADGTLDTGFAASALVPPTTDIGPIQPDRKIIVRGAFTSPAGTGPSYIMRLNADGTRDIGFNPVPNNSVSSAMLHTDGKIVIGGAFTSVNGVPRNKIARLNADGTLDTGFNPNVEGPFSGVSSIAMQPDGKIILGGKFTSVGGVARNNIARLLGDSLTPIQQWKLARLGDANAPDLGDSDFDGLVHLAEYALNLSPTAPSLPPPAERHLYAEGGRLRMFFTRDPARNDVTLEVQSAGSPAGPVDDRGCEHARRRDHRPRLPRRR